LCIETYEYHTSNSIIIKGISLYLSIYSEISKKSQKTARVGYFGVAYTFVTMKNEAKLEDIENFIHIKIKRINMGNKVKQNAKNSFLHRLKNF
jgi:superfamily II DNA/RNA helicase